MPALSLRLLLVIFLFFLISCSKDEAPQEEIPQLNIKVFSSDGEAFGGVTFRLLSEGTQTTFSSEKAVSSTDGIVEFALERGKKYNLYLVASSNYGSLQEEPRATYYQLGVFENLEETMNYPAISFPAQIGDPKYADINGDGTINAYDLVIPLEAPAKGNIDLTLTLTKQQASD